MKIKRSEYQLDYEIDHKKLKKDILSALPSSFAPLYLTLINGQYYIEFGFTNFIEFTKGGISSGGLGLSAEEVYKLVYFKETGASIDITSYCIDEEWSEYIDLCTKAQLADVKYINKQRRNREILSDRKKGMTQKEVGEKYGVAKRTIYSIESGNYIQPGVKNCHSKPPRPVRFEVRQNMGKESIKSLIEKIGQDSSLRLALSIIENVASSQDYEYIVSVLGKSDDSCSQ